MKITQEVREFAAKQNSGVETFVAAEEAEAGIVEMAEKYRDGGDLNVPLVDWQLPAYRRLRHVPRILE